MAAAGNDEGFEWLELLVALVDGVLEGFDAAVIDVGFGEVLVHLVQIGGGEQGADAEKIALNRNQNLVDPRQRLDGAGEAEDGVQLVDVTVGFDPRIVLGNASSAEEAGVAGIARFGVDLHQRKFTTKTLGYPY